MTVSQPITASGAAAGAVESADTAATMAALQARTPAAGNRPFSAAATVPTAKSAAKPVGSAYGDGNPGRCGRRRAA